MPELTSKRGRRGDEPHRLRWSLDGNQDAPVRFARAPGGKLMRVVATCVTCLLASLALVALRHDPGHAQAARSQTADDAAIRDLVAKYVDAREQRSAAAIEELFTEDADQLTSSGEWRRGRDQVVRGALASSERTGGTRTITVETVRLLAPNLAVADGRYEIAGVSGGDSRRMWTTFVLAQGANGWRIAAIRNMLPAS
ncbi:MAG: SgcJ/EcaC family oxidoreductase [Luteitalea sp.]|nr:SgcJ/EcaC family oxidoreductase [Luteitalea sp.]